MKKFFSLLKAMMSQDMNVFRYKNYSSNSNIRKMLIPIVLSVLVMFSIGSLYFGAAIELNKIDMMPLILSLALAFPSILAVTEGIYKAPGILFEAKDSDMLFALPISKKHILMARLIKLYIFQLLYSMLFVLPGMAVYVFFENPGIDFYLISLLMILTFPIIPTIIGSIIGFWVKKISLKFKTGKTVQTALTIAFMAIIMIVSFNMNNYTELLVNNSESINNTLLNVYYPIAAYQKLITNFDVLTLLILIAINVAFIGLFLLVTSKTYFKALSKSKENNNYHASKSKPLKFEKNNQLRSLIKKEFSTYTSSQVYMFNTLFGLILLVIGTFALCTNFDNAITSITADEIPIEDVESLRMLAPKIFLAMIIAISFMTSITSSSISLEGKKFNILKSIPTKVDTILLAKILMSNIITIPVILLCNVIFFCFNKASLMDILMCLIASVLAPSISAVFGLLVNLKYPKMDATSDAEVVKQSTSSMVSVLGGMAFAGIFFVLIFVLAGIGDLALASVDIILLVILLALWRKLRHYGEKRFREIEV